MMKLLLLVEKLEISYDLISSTALGDGVNSRVLPGFVFKVEEYATPNYTGMKPMV